MDFAGRAINLGTRDSYTSKTNPASLLGEKYHTNIQVKIDHYLWIMRKRAGESPYSEQRVTKVVAVEFVKQSQLFSSSTAKYYR